VRRYIDAMTHTFQGTFGRELLSLKQMGGVPDCPSGTHCGADFVYSSDDRIFELPLGFSERLHTRIDLELK
jgi:hypothetical protein